MVKVAGSGSGGTALVVVGIRVSMVPRAARAARGGDPSCESYPAPIGRPVVPFVGAGSAVPVRDQSSRFRSAGRFSRIPSMEKRPVTVSNSNPVISRW